MARRTYRGTDIEVTFDDDLCIHATECVRGLSEVFDRDHRPWIRPDDAPAEQVSMVVERCPTGALTYRRLDGQVDERTRPVTVVTTVENGPLVLRGDLVVRRTDGQLERLPRAALCRCGRSGNKPFCDGSHLAAGFEAAGAMQAPAPQLSPRGAIAVDPTVPGAP
ncbi:MAG TPA: (4Fe-4S)-binding protein [Nocardioides sp.]|jgi:uncharacterized Fe-S cluster protein YjdI/CDGSH-type Zn-finger protein|uniref:(4Fe-4S)-binding protein n=1 Tax=Nocardioides sp. TaxID=35761 RepID=UPI002E37987B|nr:(4Fe-4S)-binding protein [Nocardioides sp.]HEX3932853.1 (4Fe-4S)-binding protein [Nocardioides sp.]